MLDWIQESCDWPRIIPPNGNSSLQSNRMRIRIGEDSGEKQKNSLCSRLTKSITDEFDQSGFDQAVNESSVLVEKREGVDKEP